MVVPPVDFAGAGCAGSVYVGLVGGKGKVKGRNRGGEAGRETEKPNLSGWSAKRRLSMVDLPVPDGPDITTGRGAEVTGCMGNSQRDLGSESGRVWEWNPHLLVPWW